MRKNQKEYTVDIVAHIRQLLVLHDCVIVPDFGGFVANYQPAEIDFERHVFSPPSKRISFNRNLSGNDGLLVGYISERQGMGYVDARRAVSGFVKEVKDRLEKGAPFHFEDIGRFQYDNRHNLQFEPDNTRNYLIGSYGLSRFTATPLEDYDVRKKIRKFRDQPPAGKRPAGKTLRRVLIAIPVLVALALIPLKTHYLDDLNLDFSSFQWLQKKEAVTEQTATPGETARYSDDVEEGRKEETQPVMEEKEIPVEETPEEPLPAPAANRYYLIAGSFRLAENARTLKDELASEGYPSEILEAGNGYLRVSMSAFDNKEEALQSLQRIRQQPGRQSVWLLKNQ